MNSIADKPIVLKLNKLWQPTGVSVVWKAIVDLYGGENSHALDIDYPIGEDGTPDFSNPNRMNPVGWDEWSKLPIRDWDFSIRSAKMEIRVPTVLISRHYSKMPIMSFKGKPTKEALFIRDEGTDQYTGKKLSYHDASIDHVIPKSHGGKDEWENVVITHHDINSMKGNRFNKDIGLKVIKTPRAPLPMPRWVLIREPRHPDWIPFLIKK